MRRPDFHGAEYVANIDHDRLKTQQERVEDFMLDGQFHTLEEISLGTGAPPASASAQLRNLSDPKTGTYARERRPRGDRAKGLFEYRLIRRPPDFMLTRVEMKAELLNKISFHSARIAELSARYAELCEVDQ